MSNRIENFETFFPYYLAEHTVPACRALHYAGTTLGTALAVYAIASGQFLWLLFWPLFGYGFAWAGHFAIEKNKPATFKNPLWSLMGDYKMFWLFLTGRLKPELVKAERLYGGGTGAANRA